jgi:hypothetical protein
MINALQNIGLRHKFVRSPSFFIIMNVFQIKRALKQFTGTERYHKNLFPGQSPILLTDGCDFIRTHCNAHWLFDAILSYHSYVRIRHPTLFWVEWLFYNL